MYKSKSKSIPIREVSTALNGAQTVNLSTISLNSVRAPGFPFPSWRHSVVTASPATTPLTGELRTGIPVPYSFVTVYPSGQTTKVEGQAFYIPSPGSIAFQGRVTSRASVDFQSKAAEAMRSFDSGSFIGEIHKTIQLIRHPFKDLTHLTRQYFQKSRSLIGSKRHQRALYRTYLEYTYGVKPLLYDVDSLAKTLAQRSQGVGVSVVTGKYSETLTSVPVDQSLWAAGFIPGTNSCRLKGSTASEHSCIIKGAVKLKRVSDVGASAWAEGLGLGLDQFIPTVYNLIPYSFLLDYVSNVGSFLTAVSNYRASYAWSNSTYAVRSRFTGAVIFSRSDTTFKTKQEGGGGISTEVFQWDRTSGIPPISLSALYVQVPSLHQTLNVLALFGAAIQGRK